MKNGFVHYLGWWRAWREATLRWLKFAHHGEYYVAKALVAKGKDPTRYGLARPENGACYRGMCNVGLLEGGCGGMGPEVLVRRPTK